MTGRGPCCHCAGTDDAQLCAQGQCRWEWEHEHERRARPTPGWFQDEEARRYDSERAKGPAVNYADVHPVDAMVALAKQAGLRVDPQWEVQARRICDAPAVMCAYCGWYLGHNPACPSLHGPVPAIGRFPYFTSGKASK